MTTATSIFSAGVDESDDKRGDPKNVKRRMTRHTRVTLARRAGRKRALRLKLIAHGLLPKDPAEFKILLETTDPWTLRSKGLRERLTPFEFGRVLLHLSQRRGALGLKIADDADAADAEKKEDDGKVKAAIGEVCLKMKERNADTFGEFIAMVQAERSTPILTQDKRPEQGRKGPREYRGAIRNKSGSYEHCADRSMIRHEFSRLWSKQSACNGDLSAILTDALRLELDNASADSIWRQRGILFGQRRTYWDTGTLGRCDLEPTERCVPHADMYASQYLVVETLNNLRVIERGMDPRPLTADERKTIRNFLSEPLGLIKVGKQKGQPKRSVSVTDLRELMGTSEQGWGKANKNSRFRFNIEADDDRVINTDWFLREIVHGAVTSEKWATLLENTREGINRAILKFDPEQIEDSAKLKSGVMRWAGLSETQADALVAAWKKRPKLDAKRLNVSRRAVRNLLVFMDRPEPWSDPQRPNQMRWLTQIEARKMAAEDGNFRDVTTDEPLSDRTRQRYFTGAKGATSRDRYYMRKHLLRKNGELLFDPNGLPLAEPPPAPLISNPVVRKAIHEVRRHLIEYIKTFGRRPDEVYIELAREAKMGKKDADQALFRNRLRNRIRNDVISAFDLDSRSSTQQRAAVERVVLCLQQNGVCSLCGNQAVKNEITPRMAADGEGCEVAHILPRASGGHNGMGNIVLAHTKCNRDMARRTPRQFWEQTLKGGFDEGMNWVEKIYGDVSRPKASEMKGASAESLWKCYFQKRDDDRKTEQFKKDITHIKGMTNRQDAATKYATRQVMAYLADALFEGKGLPERSGERLIYATDGLWTSRLRREWGLFYDPHQFKAKGLTANEEHVRKEKNRGDHRHHAIDAILTALCTRQVQLEWEEREKKADAAGVNTANEEAMENYRRLHPLAVPRPFASREDLREAVRRAVYGSEGIEKPICHRAVKRKVIGALHEESLFGPVLDRAGRLTGNFTARKSVLALKPNHLLMPRPETNDEAVDRLATVRQWRKGIPEKDARKWARSIVSSSGFTRAIVDPPPGKPGIVRDVALRARLRKCIADSGLSPDDFSPNQMKKLVESGAIRHASGVPIKSVVLLRTMADPVVVSRWATYHATGTRYKVYNAETGEGNASAARAYVGGNNHHIEIRMAKDKKGKENWSGRIVATFEVAKRKLTKLKAFRKAGIPEQRKLRKLPKCERAKFNAALREIENAHPMVDRSSTDEGDFIMSLCEGEMLMMRRKVAKGEPPGVVGYFVVAKLEKPQAIFVVPHWDARAATERKDSDGKPVPDSKREQFAVTPSDLKQLAPPGHLHAVKVRVSPLGVVKMLDGD